MISAARCALLLGDPQQLPQVSQGSHPDPVEHSVLEHILKGHKTIPDEYGYFLNSSYRLHPLLSKRVSVLQYEGKLISEARCARRDLKGVDPGLHVVLVEHWDNTMKSEEEAAKLVEMIPSLLGRDWIDTDKESGLPLPARALTEKDILVVTAYNKQVRCIKGRLKEAGYSDIRVGTFDKFQGQAAAVVFVSMATSSRDDLPRGIEFLLSQQAQCRDFARAVGLLSTSCVAIDLHGTINRRWNANARQIHNPKQIVSPIKVQSR